LPEKGRKICIKYTIVFNKTKDAALLWLPLDEDFADKERFAGEQNIAHIMNIARMYPLP